MAFYSTVVTMLGTLAIVATVLAIAIAVALCSSRLRMGLNGALAGNARHPIAWASSIAALAMAGSLYLSEVVQLPPCTLCWYQRIAMYPLVVLFGVAAVREDLGIWRYGLPLTLVGLGIAMYHVIIQWMPSLDVGACTTGAPCTGRYLAIFGFVSIPTMAAAAFLLILSLLFLMRSLEGASSKVRSGRIEDPAENDLEAEARRFARGR